MILVYKDIFEGGKKHRINANVSYESSQCHYGQPVIILPDGGAIDLISWVSLGYEVVRANKSEKLVLSQLGLI